MSHRRLQWETPDPPGEAARKAELALRRLGEVRERVEEDCLTGAIALGTRMHSVQVCWTPWKGGSLLTACPADEEGAVEALSLFREIYTRLGKRGLPGGLTGANPAFVSVVLTSGVLLLLALLWLAGIR